MGELTRSCLINARDLGRGWKTTQQEYAPRWKVKRPAIDPGMEEDGSSCSTVALMDSPDGVKTDLASHLLVLKDAKGRVSVRTAVVVFPHERNARARAEAYAENMRGCPGHMRYVMQSWAMPPDFASRSYTEVEALTLPVDGFGLRTITRTGSEKSFFNYRDVVIHRGRMVAGLSVHGLGIAPDQVNVDVLAKVLSDRLERAAKSLRPSRVHIPVYTPDPFAARIANAALATVRDFPAQWRDRAFEEYGYDSGTSVYPGSLLLALDALRPEPGMVARAVATETHVGWSHYISHHVAVYTSERRARAAAKAAFGQSIPRNGKTRPRRRGKITARIIDMPALDDTRAQFRIKTWRMPAWRENPATDVTSTDTAAVIRRGRMVSTWALAAKGEHVKTAHKLLKKVVRKLERAEAKLRS